MATKKPNQNSQGKATGPKMLKKITVKEVCGVPLLKDIPEGEVLPLMRVAGFARGVKGGESTYGEWAALVGEFAATNLKTGEVVFSPTCIIPSTMGELLVQRTEGALREDATSQVQFKVEIGVQISTRDPNKYEYIVTPIQEAGAINPAVALLTAP